MPKCHPKTQISPIFQSALVELQLADDPESLWNAVCRSAQAIFPVHHDILLACPLLGTFPVFGRTLSGYPRGEGYWARLGEIAGAGDVLIQHPEMKVARMSDHFDLSRENDRLLHDEFMVPEGWAFCVNAFFRSPQGFPIGTLGINRTKSQGDFSEGEMDALAMIQPHFEAALVRVHSQQAAQMRDLSLKRSLQRLPIPLVFLDWSLKISFVNLAGKDALHLWHRGPDKSRATNPGSELPADILQMALSVKDDWASCVKNDNYLDFEKPRELVHAKEDGIRAMLRPICSSEATAFEPGLVIEFEIPASAHSQAARAMNTLSLLTSTEREVATLVATGHENQEIGDRLGISVHTVRAHLRSVYRKLGISSRSRLAAIQQILASRSGV